MLRLLLIAGPLAWVLTRVYDYGLQAVWMSFAASGLITSAIAIVWIHRRLRALEGARGAGTPTVA
jgi:Na+-driven multidrug efflux pump